MVKYTYFCRGVKPSVTRKKRIAIIGAGPAGLTAAGFLVCQGYQVEIYDKLPLGGGLMSFAIPSWRIKIESVKEGVEDLERNFGVEFHYSTKVVCGKRHDEGDELSKDEMSLADLIEQYDVVLIATGTWGSRKMGIPGEDAEGVDTALNYLFKIRAHELGYMPEPPAPKRVVVVGGGLSAIDAAEVYLKRGTSEVYLVYRRTIKYAPAGENEMKRLSDLGIKVMELTNPTKVLVEDGKVKGVELIKMKLGEPDSSGRPRPEPIPGSEFTIETDMFVEAVGEVSTPPIGKGCSDLGIETDRKGRIKVDDKFRTRNPKVFAAGDVVTGPSLIGNAVKQGLMAARSIHTVLTSK
ncbi:MAG: FAD-dependent oxidoreductase [Desulfurococcales archaeon]|nr:FAD-dependent oxidoreductase [Desulfurococcales archaeon]